MQARTFYFAGEYGYHRRRVSGINVECTECVQFGDGLRKRRRGAGWSCCLYRSNAIVCGRIRMRLIAYYQDENVQTRETFVNDIRTEITKKDWLRHFSLSLSLASRNLFCCGIGQTHFRNKSEKSRNILHFFSKCVRKSREK